MNEQTDLQLLCAYAENHSEAAFAELVRRHVDFVYSAARRMVVDPHLAEDVTQGVFVAFAKNARQLTDRSVLSGWLHRTAQNIAAQTVRTIERRRAREQESVAMNELLAHESDADWQTIAPRLDDALGELSEPDRDVLLLRYFERKSAREMAQTLGTSEEAAQKRVNRAVERLRDFFSKRNVTIGASGLVVLISTNAVQAAPVGLFAVISAAASLAGTAVQTSTAIAATKTIAMTTLQKTLIAAAIAVATSLGIYEARHASNLQKEIQSLRQKQSPFAEELEQRRAELINATNQLASAREENELLRGNTSELLKLRGQIGLLREENRGIAKLKSSFEGALNNATNGPRFVNPYLGMNDWQDSGTSEPDDTLTTMLWAMKKGDTNKLAQLVVRENGSQSLDSLLGPRSYWDKVKGIQIVDITIDMENGSTEKTAIVGTIVEPLDPTTRTPTIGRWYFIKTNGNWHILGSD